MFKTRRSRKKAELLGILFFVIVTLTILLELYSPVRRPPTVRPTQTSSAFVSEEKIDLTTIRACTNDVQYTTRVAEEFGIAFDYPPGWFVQTYRPGEWVGSGNPGPENVAVISNVPGNFGPDYSRGTGQYDKDTGVVQILISRHPKQSSDAPGRATLKKDEEGLFWNSYSGSIEVGGYIFEFEAAVWKSSPKIFENCFSAVFEIFSSLKPINP